MLLFPVPTALLVGFILTMANMSFFSALLAFFITSSKLTRWKEEVKKKLDSDYKEGGQRNWIQVFCNGVSPQSWPCYNRSGWVQGRCRWTLGSSTQPPGCVCLCWGLGLLYGGHLGIEVGPVLSQTKPRLITSWREVPTG
ncbi:transmembrane protein 19 isoform X2 [Salvelinus sp. IW2-2015]